MANIGGNWDTLLRGDERGRNLVFVFVFVFVFGATAVDRLPAKSSRTWRWLTFHHSKNVEKGGRIENKASRVAHLGVDALWCNLRRIWISLGNNGIVSGQYRHIPFQISVYNIIFLVKRHVVSSRTFDLTYSGPPTSFVVSI
jgi:hypothetical protein